MKDLFDGVEWVYWPQLACSFPEKEEARCLWVVTLGSVCGFSGFLIKDFREERKA